MDNLTPEQIKQMIAMLHSMLPNEDNSINKQENTEQEFTSNIKTKKVSTRQQSFKNKFIDMPEKNMHKEDREIDKILAVSHPTPRIRKAPLIDVTCRVCGKREKVPSSIVMDGSRYKCNKCCSGAG